MQFNQSTLLPYIPSSEYDTVAEEFLEAYYPDALTTPMAVPILDIAQRIMHLDVKFITLSEDLDTYGMTLFSDGMVEIYLPDEGIYDRMMFKKKTVLIDPEAYKKLNQGNVNNTIAHECFHWFAHRMYFKMQTYSLARFAKYCKCRVSELPTYTEEERIIEKQATAVAPRILMPKKTFIEKAEMLGFINQQFDANSLAELADFFDVSKQSARIRLEECSLI